MGPGSQRRLGQALAASVPLLRGLHGLHQRNSQSGPVPGESPGRLQSQKALWAPGLTRPPDRGSTSPSMELLTGPWAVPHKVQLSAPTHCLFCTAWPHAREAVAKGNSPSQEQFQALRPPLCPLAQPVFNQETRQREASWQLPPGAICNQPARGV